jgi:ATP-dependent helicase HrpB
VLAKSPYIAVAELTGTAANGRILLAAPIAQLEIEQQFADHIQTDDEITFDRAAMALRARRRKKLHAITLSEQTLAVSPSGETARVLADGLVAAGIDRLPWSKALKQWRDRVMFLRAAFLRTGPISPTTRLQRHGPTGWCPRCSTRPRCRISPRAICPMR